MLIRSLPASVRTRGVTAVLGPTNTGKTHYALERMTAHATGMIGLPLRLLAREVYGRLVARVGVQAVALVTILVGETIGTSARRQPESADVP
jgi:ATP-dependent RNA helicase SUPV3L1/SUV3